LCSFCTVDYDFIAHFEEFDDEVPHILDQLKIQKQVSKTILRLPENERQISYDLTQAYFSMLSDEDILKLYQIYKMDFELFQYSFKIRNLTLN